MNLPAPPRMKVLVVDDEPLARANLRVLLDAGLVEFDQTGTRNLYRLERDGFDTLRTWLDSFWEDVLGAFEAYANRPDNGDPT